MLFANLFEIELILIILLMMTLFIIYVLLYKHNNRIDKKDNKCINCTSLNCIYKQSKLEEIYRNCEEEEYEK